MRFDDDHHRSRCADEEGLPQPEPTPIRNTREGGQGGKREEQREMLPLGEQGRRENHGHECQRGEQGKWCRGAGQAAREAGRAPRRGGGQCQGDDHDDRLDLHREQMRQPHHRQIEPHRGRRVYFDDVDVEPLAGQHPLARGQ